MINHLQFFGSVGSGNQKDTQVMLGTFEACSRLLSLQRDSTLIKTRSHEAEGTTRALEDLGVTSLSRTLVKDLCHRL